MKETVLSAKTSGTATKRFEVIVEVIKIKKTQNFFFFFFLRRALFSFSELVQFSRSGSHIDHEFLSASLILLYMYLITYTNLIVLIISF